MFVLVKKHVVGQASTIDDVLGLLRDVRFMRLQVKLVTPTTEFIRRVIFQTDTAELSGTIISPQPESIHIEFSQF